MTTRNEEIERRLLTRLVESVEQISQDMRELMLMLYELKDGDEE